MPHETQRNVDMDRCVQECHACHAVCAETITHCLMMGGPHANAEHIALLLDGAKICETSADFLARGSRRHASTCAICAEICEQCAQDCERLGGDDEQMQRCAVVCRQCAASCRQMAGGS